MAFFAVLISKVYGLMLGQRLQYWELINFNFAVHIMTNDIQLQEEIEAKLLKKRIRQTS
jgi:hypothetical protein